MSLLVRQDRPNVQKHNVLYFISGIPLFKLTAHDMKSAFWSMRNWKIMDLRNTHPRESKWLILNLLKPQAKFQPLFRLLLLSPMTLPSQYQPLFNLLTSRKVSNQMNHLKCGYIPSKNPISTTINLDEACPLDTSCDHLRHLDSPSQLSELQDNSSADSVEIELLPESEGQLDHTKLSPTDVFSEHHEYELFLLQKKFGAPNVNLNHYDIYNCENQDDILIHATNLSNTFGLPQLMAQNNCEDQDPTDYPSAVPTASQASCDHTIKHKCAHNRMVTQCNQSQYRTLMKKNSVHSLSASQASQTHLSNFLVSQYPPDPGERILKRSATSTGEQDIPVQWFKFIHPIPKPRMPKTSFQIAVHVAYSHIASMTYKWTINLHDGYPLFQDMKPEGYIPPPLHISSNHKLTMFHLGDEYLCTSKIILPPGYNGESPEAAANEEDAINDDLYKHKAQKGHQRPHKAPYPNLNMCKYNVLLAWQSWEKIYEPVSVLEEDGSGTLATYDGWKMHKNLAKSDKHNLSSLAPPKGEMKSSFSLTSFFKSPTSSTLCFGEPTLGKLCSLSPSTLWDPTLAKINQEITLCITKHIPIRWKWPRS